MSNDEKLLYKDLGQLATIELSPSENHLLSTLVKMNSVPEALHPRVQIALENVHAQPVTREVADILMEPKLLSTATDGAHDVYTYFRLWAGKEPGPNSDPNIAA